MLCYYDKTAQLGGKLAHIPPIMTTPFDFKTNRSVVPKWDECVVFNEEFAHFIRPSKPNVLVLFELLDNSKQQQRVTGGNEPAAVATSAYLSEDTSADWIRVAWAFLKLVGNDNKTLNVEKRMRLQLFYTPTGYQTHGAGETLLKPHIYELYKSGPRVKYPASLYVTVKSITAPPSVFRPAIGSYYALEHDAFMQFMEGDATKMMTTMTATTAAAAAAGDVDSNNKKPKQLAEGDAAVPPHNDDKESGNEAASRKASGAPAVVTKTLWSRLPGMPCRIPNELMLSVSGAKRGCYSLRFAPSGDLLACGCVEENNVSPVYVYAVPSGRLVAKYLGHFGLVHELDWSPCDTYLLTASSDATARIFDVTTSRATREPVAILPHPTYVYTARFHPSPSGTVHTVATAGYDKVVRIWSIGAVKVNNNKNNNKTGAGNYGQLLLELFGHTGYINSLCFANDGTRLYSADSAGCIKAWSSKASTHNGRPFSFSPFDDHQYLLTYACRFRVVTATRLEDRRAQGNLIKRRHFTLLLLIFKLNIF